jgi:hypothetical protein
MFPLPILLGASLSEAAAPSAQQGTAIECAVALQVIEDGTPSYRGDTVVFSTKDDRNSIPKAEFLRQGWTRNDDGKSISVDPPPPEVVDEFVRGVRNSIPRCSSVRKWLTVHKIRYGRAAIDALAAQAVDDELPGYILTVSLPTVSSDGQVALIYTANQGAGFAHIYRRQDDGTWKHVASHMLWIS